VIDRGEYQSFVHPVTDCCPQVDADLLGELSAEIAERVDPSMDGVVSLVEVDVADGSVVLLG